MKVIQNLIGEQLLRAHARIARTHNKNAGNRIIDLTKNTYLKNLKLSNAGERYSKKLGLKFIPVNITKQVGKDTYLVSDKQGKHLGKFHASLLMQR